MKALLMFLAMMGSAHNVEGDPGLKQHGGLPISRTIVTDGDRKTFIDIGPARGPRNNNVLK